MFQYAVTFIIAFFGSFVQSITGFGAPIIILMVLPSFMPLLPATGTSSVMCMGCQLTSLYTHRKRFDLSKYFKNAVVPTALYLGISVPTIMFVKKVDLVALKLAFGVFLVLLAAYYVFFSGKVQIKPTLLTGIVCGSISGLLSGLFGIGGPLMALYFLGVAGDDKYFYIMLTQISFFLASFVNLIARVANGILTVECIPYMAVGVVGMIIGTRIASRFIDKIDAKVFKRIIYVLVAISGIMNIVQSL